MPAVEILLIVLLVAVLIVLVLQVLALRRGREDAGLHIRLDALKDDGERLQRAPRFSAATGVTWRQSINDNWSTDSNLQYQYSSSYLNQSAIAPGINTSGAYGLLDFRLGLSELKNGLEFSLRADNLLDRRYREYSYGSLLSTAYLPGAGGTPLGSVGVLNRPRIFTLGVRKSF